jgi:sulfur-carrier protein adenylyltransferase/sulfurtransferase
MSNNLYARYLRQIRVSEFGEDAQKKLTNASALVIGAGALGCPVLMYLTAAGIGKIGVLDGDDVDITNLHRQVLYTDNDLGKPKALTASKRLKDMNPGVDVIPLAIQLHRDNALDILSKYDVIIDCTDNFPSKFLVNDACVILKKPGIIGGVMRFSGQLSVYNFNGGPTYRCFIPEEPDPLEAPSCAEAGVIGMIPGIIGTMQALEALKIITGTGKTLSGRLLNFDGLTLSFNEFDIHLNPNNLKIKELSEYEFSCPDHIIKGRAIGQAEFLEMINGENPPHILAFADDTQPISALAYEWETIPIYELPNKVQNLPTEKDIILICEYGIKSLAALRYLVVKRGFDRVYHLNDGISTLKRTV